MAAAFRAGAAYFIAVFAAGFVLGTLRVMWLAAALSEIIAVLIELPIMLGISWLSCKWLVRRLAVPASPAYRAIMGGSAFICLMLAEAILAITLFNETLPQFVSGFAELPAQLGLAGQIAFALMPWLEGLQRKR